MPLSQAAKILPAKVDFSSLQNLIMGEPLREGCDNRRYKHGWAMGHTGDEEDSS